MNDETKEIILSTLQTLDMRTHDLSVDVAKIKGRISVIIGIPGALVAILTVVTILKSFSVF